MKTLRSKSLMSILYAVILSIPMISILSRVIYVQSNKNAYQSYSGYNIETNTELAISIESGLNYQMTSNEYTGSLSSSTYIEVSNINANSNSTSFNNAWSTQQNSIKYINFGYTGSTTRFYYYRDDMSVIDSWSLNQSLMLNLSFTASNNATLNNNDLIYKVYQQQVGNSLDNVFDYSVNQLVDENNFGQLNFFEWFSSWLLSDLQNNMLYVRFANWYLNYALLVSLMQIIFLCLMWFVNFSRRLLERGMNYDW